MKSSPSRNLGELKTIGAEVYYRDAVGGRFMYVRGRVTDHRPVKQAEREWDQKWSHRYGTILEIEPIDRVDDSRRKYRHMSGVLHPRQYAERAKKTAA